MKDYQRDFLAFAISQQVLTFGTFTLKSGRTSPYFFNSGKFNSGASLSDLGKFYAAALQDSNLEFDVLLGPAYKGIPLVASAVIALSRDHGKDVPYSFNRKEKKDHGEGGNIVGSSLKGKRVVVVDDVITAGTAIRESFDIIKNEGGLLAGILISLNRQERGSGETKLSAIQQVQQDYGVPVHCIVSLKDLAEYLRELGRNDDVAAITKYWEEFGVDTL
ncbi:hypothetical protein HDU97_006703 [Phlyctochytrium planicorne]|nr:hypothetical protein HDU97_006703 [Phlyctochytrium planicorne]